MTKSLKTRELIDYLLRMHAREVFMSSRGAVLRRKAWYTGNHDETPASFRESYKLDTADQVISKQLFIHGEFDFHKFRRAFKQIDQRIYPTSHLVDVGANLGSICIPAVKRGYVSGATAIEANPKTVSLLAMNVNLNGLSEKIEVRAAAASNSRASLRLDYATDNLGATSICQRSAQPRSIVEPSVNAILIDDVTPNYGALIFMDVEGYELKALQGADEAMSQGVPVAMEFNPSHLSRYSDISELGFLNSSYTCFVSLNDPLGIHYDIKQLEELWRIFQDSTNLLSTDVLLQKHCTCKK